jgi:hypothetical protein
LSDEVNLKNISFNRIAQRGGANKATLASGHVVHKADYIVATKPDDGAEGEKPVMFEVADYHGEHFIYADPLYEAEPETPLSKRWFAMCTCGSAAVIIDAATAISMGIPIKGNQIVVCHFYTNELWEKGEHAARHQTSYINKREVERGKRTFSRKKK